MRRRIINFESSQSRAGAVLLRRLGCGLWFLFCTPAMTRERRRRRGTGRLAAPRLGYAAVKLPKSLKTTDRFNRFLMPALLAALTYSAPLWAQSAALSLASGQEVTPAGNELTWPREFEDNGTKVDIYQPQIEKWSGTDFET